jgi:Tfp pilus assembly protein PilO
MLFEGGFTFANFLVDVLVVFMFVVWFWLLLVVLSDLFRRQDISGWMKALLVVALIVFPFVGVLGYLIIEGDRMAERSSQRAQQARDELRRVVGFSIADEIEKLERLKNSRSITNDEFARLRGRLVQ